MIHLPTHAPRRLYVATILLGSFLLFLVQPMIARIALPRLGGAPAVWNSAMLVYQALLLGGYAYAHLLGRLTPRAQGWVHLAVLAAAAVFLPIGLNDRVLPAGAEPAIWVPWLFAVSIGPLFFAVSAQAPLVQRWFALVRPGEEPYALYAASNVGSFAGLVAFPLLVEPLMPVTDQRWLWSAGYVALIALVALCVRLLPATGGQDRSDQSEIDTRSSAAKPTLARWSTWIVLGLVPSGLMLATSTFISTDLLAMPLLWVLPLALYLLSFSVAFASNRTLADAITRYAPVTMVVFGGILMGGFTTTALLAVFIALMVLFVASVALHTRLYRLRPAPAHLTSFYLAMSLGGALGGVFAGLVAPVIFDWTWEYPILILATGFLMPQSYLAQQLARLWLTPRSRLIAIAIYVVVLAALFLLALEPIANDRASPFLLPTFVAVALLGIVAIGARLPYMVVLASSLALFGGLQALSLSIRSDARTRSYFGVYTIADAPRRRTLIHGTTVHGVQLAGNPTRERTPTTYYVPGSGVGRVMTLAPALYGPAARIGVVGLGTGTLACYHHPGQRWRFYEIDPTMVRVAEGSRFTFLARCAPDAPIVIGDARLSLERQADMTLDVLALDAFSSDAVPMHLLTLEAFDTYGRVLSPRGTLAVHISNRYLNLVPVVAAAARARGWHAAILNYTPDVYEEDATKSAWVVMTRDAAVFDAIRHDGGEWTDIRPRPGFHAWTDDYGTILPLLRF
ncbi:fused MFS/spermidine synthase [Sphingomonas sp.]|uniref:fused MFS/spermidine synthase n=1 Tax=Sphingomonas sp. TaxID=28214 RepID=UPI0035C7DCD9